MLNIDVTRLNTDLTLHSWKNGFLSTYIDSMMTESITVPAVINHERFLLDFEHTFSTVVGDMERLSKERTLNLINLIVTSIDKLSSLDLAKQIMDEGLLVPATSGRKKGGADRPPHQMESDKVEELVAELQKVFMKKITETGVQGILVEDVFGHRLDFSDLTALKTITFPSVKDTVGQIQDFHRSFVNMQRGDELSARINTMISVDPLLLSVRSMIAIFRSGTGAYVPVRKSHVFSELSQRVFGSTLLDMEEIIPGKIYNVSNINMPDMYFSTPLGIFMWSLGAITGLDFSAGSGGSVTMSDFASTIVTGIGDIAPFMPTEAGVYDERSAIDIYRKVFFLHLAERVIKDQPGSLYGSVRSAIASNKYFFKTDSLESGFDQNLYCMSVAFETFIDTAVFFRNFVGRQDILFKDQSLLGNDHPMKRKQVADFVDTYIFSQYKQFVYGSTHPAYLKQAAHLFTGDSTWLSPTNMSFDESVDRHSLMTLPKFMSVDGSEVFSIAAASFTSGSVYDIEQSELPYDRRVLFRAGSFSTYRTANSFLNSPLMNIESIRRKLSVTPLYEIADRYVKYPFLRDFIAQHGVINFYRDPADMADKLQWPREIVDIVWRNALLSAVTDADLSKTLRQDQDLNMLTQSVPLGYMAFVDLSGLNGVLFGVTDVTKSVNVKYVPAANGSKYPLIVAWSGPAFASIRDTYFSVDKQPVTKDEFNSMTVPVETQKSQRKVKDTQPKADTSADDADSHDVGGDEQDTPVTE